MYVFDLSHTITPSMPVYPGTSAPRFTPLTSIMEHGFQERTIDMGSHTGTHMDAPGHILENGEHLDTLDVSRFAGPACLIDVRGKKGVEVEDIKPYAAELHDAAFCLILTGWDLFWGRREYFENFPVMSMDAARYLATFSLSGVGVDTVSVDAVDSDLPVHRILLSSGMVLIENLCNLDTLPESPFLFVAAPLKFERADGSPVRALAIVEHAK